MAKIRIDLAETLVDGMDIKFKAPCSCNEIVGLIVYYPAEDETTKTKDFVFRDAHGNDLTGIGNLFAKDAYVKVIVDTEKGYAYLQNADNNGYLNSAIFGTYTHDAENLIGTGENGKFKATVSGTISTIKVNGVNCSVKCGEDSTMDLIAGCWYTFILDGNTVNFSSGGAGSSLNFKVVGGTTEPVSPRENTIWINTDTEISGYQFAAVVPQDPAEGMVWIAVGLYGNISFSATKKNPVMVYPLSVQQYIAGEWVEKDAKIRQVNAWVDFETKKYYFKAGSGQLVSWSKKTSSTSDVIFTTNSIAFDNPSGSRATAFTAEPVDLRRYTTLYFDHISGGTFGVASAVGSYSDVTWIVSKNSSTGVCSVDISAVDSGYIAIQSAAGSQIYNVWAE